MEPFISLRDITRAILIAFFGGAFFLGIYILLSGQDWYQEMGVYFREYPLALIIIVACGFCLALAAALLTDDD